jgi:hypothetical protein
VPLSGLAIKVRSASFLLALSSVETEAQRNLELLKERRWVDIPVVYDNGRRAIIAVEKGTVGERAFEEAFRAWKSAPPATKPLRCLSIAVFRPNPDQRRLFVAWWACPTSNHLARAQKILPVRLDDVAAPTSAAMRCT